MKLLAAAAALTLTLGSTAMPAFARDSYVLDNAHLFSAATVSAINAKVADFSATAHKEVFVDTESTVDGTPQAAAEAIFAKQQVNGVLIYIAKSPKTIGVIPDQASRTFFPPTSTSAIRTAIKSAFNSSDFDGGITNGVDLTLSEYRSHLGALTRQKTSYAPIGSGEVRSSQAGFNMSWIWILIVLAVIFFVIRGIFRAMAGPRMMPPGYGGGGPMMGGGGYGPGYGGGGYGGGGGGGGFWSGLMGGLGGAFLGNELFGGGRRDDFSGNQAGFGDQGQSQSQADTSGFQSDPGQADMGNASFGGFGGSGDSDGGGGGWGDSGGGGGSDFGGGGGGGDSSGGGW